METQTTAITNLYHIIFEGTNRFPFPSSAGLSPPHGTFVTEKKTLGLYHQQLPGILQKMLLFWRNASSNKSWALEKFSEVFCSDIASNPDILSQEDLAKFVDGFFDENGKLLLYPDFMMNEVSKVFTAILLSGALFPDNLKQSVFSIIRSAFDYGFIDKGHRLHVVFQCFQQLFSNPIGQSLMQKYDFDVSFALGISLISGHNYTRKSSKNYLVALVKFAFEETCAPGEDQLSRNYINTMETKAKIKDTLLKNMCACNQNLIGCHNGGESRSSSAHYDSSIVAQYCEILCSCAVASDEWCKSLDGLVKHQHQSLFNLLLSLLKDLQIREYSDDHQLTVRTVQTLIKLSNMEDNAKVKEENIDTLFKFIIKHLCQQNTRMNLNELMQICHALLFQCDCCADVSRTLLELSLFPLLSILGVPLSCKQYLKPELVKRFAQRLQVETCGKFPVLIDLAVKTAFELDLQKIDPDLLPVVNYVTVKSREYPPIISQPFLNREEIRNAESLACTLSCFRHITPILYNNPNEIEPERIKCIEQYVEALFKTTFTSYEHLHTAFSCFLALLRHKPKAWDSNTSPDKLVVSSVIASLQLHMVSVNLTIREEAVKCVRELYLSDDVSVTEELTAAKAIVSLWHCVKDKAESVVFEVLDFILCVAERGMLTTTLLSCTNLTQEELVTEVQNILLSSPWDSVKSTAFHILSTICQTSDIVKYAEASLALENPNLTTAVLKYIQKLFEKLTADEKNFELLCRALVEGWGDLLLRNVNAQDVNAFRMAMDILVNLHNFIVKSEVNEAFKKMLMVALTEFEQNSREKHLRDSDVLFARKEKLLSYWRELGNSLRRLQKRHETIDKEFDNDLNEPSSKTIKLEDKNSSVHLADSELFIYSVARCNKENALTLHQRCLFESMEIQYGDDCVIDSTKELPPLQLKTKPFPSQELLYALLASEEVDLNSATSWLLTFMNFKGVLAKLDISKLHDEAHRSTDQYARNEDMILEDLNNLLETTFSQTSRQLERKITGTFISEFLDLIKCFLETNDKNNESFLTSLDNFIAKISHLTLSRRHVFEYIISKKKTVFLEKWTPESCSFTLDVFLERFRHLQIQGTNGMNLNEYYPNIKDLKYLLDAYTDERSLHQTSESQSESIEENLKTEKTSVLPGSIDLRKMFENMVHENHKHPDKILLWLERVCEILRQTLKDAVNVAEELQKIQTLITEMNDWYNEEEDEFDDDNDPTLIDCF